MLIKREVSLIDTKKNEELLDLVKYYKEKLVKHGKMREIKNSCTTYKRYKKVK